jgi:hypothetical protein
MFVYPFNRQGGADGQYDDTQVIPVNLQAIPRNPVFDVFLPSLRAEQ